MKHTRSDIEDRLRQYYIERGMGNYREAVEEFFKKHPDLWREDASLRESSTKHAYAKKLEYEMRSGDRDEDETRVPAPSQVMLDFGIDPPFLSQSVVVEDDRQRIPMGRATLPEHRDHHQRVHLYHLRGGRYRARATESCEAAIVSLRESGIANQDTLPWENLIEELRAELARLKAERQQRQPVAASDAQPTV